MRGSGIFRIFAVMIDETRAKKNVAREWLKGIPYEVAFWRSYYANERRRNDLFGWSLYGKPCNLEGFDIDGYIAGCGVDNPIILDVGCALSYAFGNIINGTEADVRYVDPLAPFYNKILERYKIQRPRITYGMVEALSASFAPGSVTFIHIRNALDHCANPFGGILQALSTLRIGGVLYLNHFRNEAQNEGYRGFHQYNITEQDGHLILWNRDNSIDVTEALAGFATTETSITDSGRIVAVITKTKPVPESLCSAQATAMQQSQMMIDTVCYFHSFGNSAGYQITRLYTTIGHRIMRLVPYSLLGRIKKLLSKK